ncbi:hypothetical protein R1sor_015004 [Riccia sorocarpa]|uniref:Uncharacterized protein n=1 Tax=Riccia sorocarpa TaxID=122646 RepID=A0ABD3HB07_9MARC
MFTVMLDGILLLDKWLDTKFWGKRGDYELHEQILDACADTTAADLQDVLQVVDGDIPEVEEPQSSSSEGSDFYMCLSPIRAVSLERPIPADAASRAEEGLKSSGPMVTPERPILPSLDSDEESFRNRLDVIYVSPEGVATAPEHVLQLPTPSTELTVTRAVGELGDTNQS